MRIEAMMGARSIDKKREDASLLLENQLCAALHGAARAISKVYMETLQKENLTYPQYLVLIALLEQDDQSVSELGEKLNLDSGTLTPLLKRMEAAEILTRRRSKRDERRVRVSLTPIGRELRKVALLARERVVEKLAMTNREILDLRGKLVQVTERLES